MEGGSLRIVSLKIGVAEQMLEEESMFIKNIILFFQIQLPVFHIGKMPNFKSILFPLP